jgi:hypothetical protein
MANKIDTLRTVIDALLRGDVELRMTDEEFRELIQLQRSTLEKRDDRSKPGFSRNIGTA